MGLGVPLSRAIVVLHQESKIYQEHLQGEGVDQIPPQNQKCLIRQPEKGVILDHPQN